MVLLRSNQIPTRETPMIEGNPPRRIGRSVFALLMGFLLVLVLTLVTDLALHAAGVFPPPGQASPSGPLLLATVYRTLYGILGSYTTARLAPYRPMEHALLGGVIGLVLSAAGAIATWNRPDVAGVHWYPLALVFLALPTAWLGGKIRTLQLNAA
jgi:hypothetical protein